MTPKEQTPDAQPENSAHGYTEGAYVQEHLSSSKEHLSSSKPESGVSEEDARRIVEWVDRNYQRNNVWEFAYKAAEYEHCYMATKQAELVEENQRLKSQLKDYCNDCQHPSVNERQATELSKLRQENEATKKRCNA